MLDGLQKLTPGVVGISTYVDYIYAREMQLEATTQVMAEGPINRLGVIIATLDFKELVENVKSSNFDAAEEQVAATCRSLESAGADFVVVTSGTTSTLTRAAQRDITIPFLGLADAAWTDAISDGRQAVGLLSTRRTVDGGIFQEAAGTYGGEVVVPEPKTAEHIDDYIFGDLIYGNVTTAGIAVMVHGLTELVSKGAEVIVLGNTDMSLAYEELQGAVNVRVVDSATVHAKAAAITAVRGFNTPA